MDEKYQVCDFCNSAFPVFQSDTQKMNFIAPGKSIFSSWTTKSRSKKKYRSYDGTSMAVPFLAGITALLWEKHPKFTPSQIIKELHKNISPHRQKNWTKEDVGNGFVQININY